MRVTDENDPFFLFNLSLGETDFQGYVHCIYSNVYKYSLVVIISVISSIYAALNVL